MISHKRRVLLKGLLGGAPLLSTGGISMLLPTAGSAAAPAFTDYKALVVFFLLGGNDAHNMILPLGDENTDTTRGRGYQTYATSRGDLRVNNRDLSGRGTNAYADGASDDEAAYQNGVYPFAPDTSPGGGLGGLGGLFGGGDPGPSYDTVANFGINSLMPELAGLFRQGTALAVANIGSLIEPVTKATLGTSALPPFLYAHNHQQRAMETGWSNNLEAAGWAGRLADLWLAHAGGVNAGSPLGLNVSYGGANRMMTGNLNSPVVLNPGTVQLFPTQRGFSPQRFLAQNTAQPHDSSLERVIKERYRTAASLHELLDNEFANTPDFSDLRDAYDNPLFTTPTAAQLELRRGISGRTLAAARDVARMISLGRSIGLQRQIFFVGMGGFDTHGPQASDHPGLLRELSLAIGSFQQAMDSLGASNDVTLFSLSDFGRTLGNNGSGTDHAWAGHNLVAGGAVNGGIMLGAMPDLTLGGDSDTSTKGRLIPTIAVDQYLATICNWFGLADADMTSIFPNLVNFRSAEDISSSYLQGLFKPG